ncbi:MAG: RNA polymerase sigma factor [Myxococcota bacterium]
MHAHAQPLPAPRGPALVAPAPAPADLTTIYREHHATVWRSLRGFGIGEPHVDDATQDVFVIVQRRLDVYDGRVPLRRWILGIARNVALKYRERSARAHARIAALDEQTPPVARQSDPADAVAQREASDLVAAFLETLRPDKRAVFTLIDIEGLSAVEAADVLDVNLNTVYSRLRVARQRFEQIVARQSARRPPWNR